MICLLHAHASDIRLPLKVGNFDFSCLFCHSLLIILESSLNDGMARSCLRPNVIVPRETFHLFTRVDISFPTIARLCGIPNFESRNMSQIRKSLRVRRPRGGKRQERKEGPIFSAPTDSDRSQKLLREQIPCLRGVSQLKFQYSVYRMKC